MMKKLLSFGLILIMISMFAGCNSGKNQYEDGKKSFASENYEEAAQHFAAAITRNPKRAEYYIDYGMTLIALGRYEDALSQFDLAYMEKDILLVKQNNKRILRGKGIAYYEMLQYEEAIDHFKKALEITELSRLDMDILYYMGNSMMLQGSYEEAIETYSAILSDDKNNATAYCHRAFCYRSMGEYEKSLADYDEAVAINRNNYEPYFGKYYLLDEKGDTTGAAEVLTKASEIDVKSSEDRYNQAKIHFYQENYELALAELNDGFTNGFAEAYYYIGEIYREKKDYQKAIYYYDIYIKDGKVTNPNVYNQIATCLIKSADYKKALEYLQAGISFHHTGSMQALKKNEIIAYESLGMYEEANEKLEEYLVSYPKDKEARKEAEFIKTRLMDALEGSN